MVRSDMGVLMFEDGKTIRVGLIGYGYAGKTFHAPLIQSVAGLELTMVGSSKRETVLADVPGADVCSNMEAVATHPEVDLLVIASPNESHYPLAVAALHAGKHVVVDKPFTVKLADARSLVELAEERGQLLSVFHNRRWDSEVLATKAIVQSGVLGEISHFETHIDRFRPQVRKRWRENAGPGAGLWFDLGPHLIDQAVQLFGLPETIDASFAVLRKGGETDDWAHVQLNYKSLRVILHTSLLVSGGQPRSVLHGTLGSWAKFGADVQERQLVAGLRPGSPGFGEDPEPGILYEGATGKQTRIPAPAANQANYYIGIREAMWGRQPNPVPPEQASAVMAMLDTSFQSGASGRVLPLELTDKEQAAFASSAC
ncbi:MAG: oxidoreductase domain protein [Bryobacterales bacterium]|nr:oxidoreductase domain protein [Bryobacterales bacterium]